MIRCPKCQEENMIGVIFCRGCGEKLDIDDITPDDVAKVAKKGNAGNVIRQIIGFIVLVVVLGGLAALFVKPDYSTTTLITDADAVKRLELIEKQWDVAGEGTTTKLTLDEGVTFARNYLGLTPELVAQAREQSAEQGEQHYLIPEEYHVMVLSENKVKVVLKSSFEMGDYVKLPVYTTLICNITNADGKVTVTPEDAAMGRMPMFKIPFLVEKMTERHTALISANQPLLDAWGKVGAITVTGDSVTLTRSAQKNK